MYRISGVFIISLIGYAAATQSIGLSGKVSNKSNKAIPSAIVTLVGQKLKDTTDAAGAYSFTGGTARTNSAPILQSVEKISITRSIVSLRLSKPSPVSIEIFDIKGNLLEKALDRPESAGEYKFDIMTHHCAANMMVIRVSIGQSASTFRYLPFNSGKRAIASPIAISSAGRSLAKLQAVVDTLKVTAAGYMANTTAISSYQGQINITLDTNIEVVGECTPSKPASVTVSGTGPHKVTVETNSDPGIKEGTIYRPTDLGSGKNYPIFAWGEGGCSEDGKSNSIAMGEIASYGYFVIADGTPGGSSSRSMGSDVVAMGKPLLAYIAWAIAENRKPCSAYYQSLDTAKISTNGFSCGGLMAEGTAGDSRITTWAFNSSGLQRANQALYKSVHTPVLMVLGGSGDMAYTNGERDYDSISALGIPIILFSKALGHGGDLFKDNGGDFAKIDIAWLNWWLKGDTGATGKGLLVGSGCTYCTDNAWEVKSKNLP